MKRNKSIKLHAHVHVVLFLLNSLTDKGMNKKEGIKMHQNSMQRLGVSNSLGLHVAITFCYQTSGFHS